jgi:uracil-DNA glycosylase
MINKIAIVGGYWGFEEEREQTPFVGYSGKELTRMLAEAGITRADCLLTNVFNFRVDDDSSILGMCTNDPKEALEGYPAYKSKKYLPSSLTPEFERLGEELREADPNIIICCGNQALWALTGRTKITKFRGTCEYASLTAPGRKAIATYNPAAVVRNWPLRATMVMDLCKAETQSHFPEIRRPQREIWIEPNVDDLHRFAGRYLRDAGRLSVDIETSGNQVTCIGFAPNPGVAIVIPFYDARKANRRYWPDDETERAAWAFVRDILRSPTPKLFQNGMYDIAFLARSMGLIVRNAQEDTMLLHHSLQPESLKSLGFMGSLYTDEGAWKHMRTETIGAEK